MAKRRDPYDSEITQYCISRYMLFSGSKNVPSNFRFAKLNFKARNLSKKEALHYVIEASFFGVMNVSNIKKILQYDVELQMMDLVSENAKVSLSNDTIDGIRFHRLDGWNGYTPKPAQPQQSAFMTQLDPRFVVMLHVLTQELKAEFPELEKIYHAGFYGGGALCHNQGRAMDFSGVRIDGRDYFVPFHWGKQPVPFPPGKQSAQWPSNVKNTSYRLDQPDSDLIDEFEPNMSWRIFKLVYEVFATHASDTSPHTSDDPPSKIGDKSLIMHPDHPTSAPGTKNGREAHNNHIHVQIGNTFVN